MKDAAIVTTNSIATLHRRLGVALSPIMPTTRGLCAHLFGSISLRRGIIRKAA